MRGVLKIGVPLAAGLATGGYALSQGEDPGSAALSAAAGGLGGAAGLLGARALAGKYANAVPSLIDKGLDKAVGKTGRSLRERINQAVINSPEYMRRGQAATLYAPQSIGNIARTALLSAPANIGAAAKPAFASAMVPAAAAAAGLGGVALGAIPGAMGVPGFQQNVAIDPESYSTQNPRGLGTPTMQYV